MFTPKNVASVSVSFSPVVELEVEPTPIKVYFRRNDGKLGQINAPVVDHEDAILAVKEHLVGNGEGWNAPVLAFIKGGKNEPRRYA